MTKTLGFNTANKRYTRLFWPMMAIYVALVLSASYFIDTDTSPLWLRISAAVAVTAPITGVLWAILRQARETDEYTRLRHLDALAFAGLTTIGITFLIGFLQIFGAIGMFEVFWIGPAFFLIFGLAKCRESLFGKTV